MLLPGVLSPSLGMQLERGRGGKPLPALLPKHAARGQGRKQNALALNPQIPRTPCHSGNPSGVGSSQPLCSPAHSAAHNRQPDRQEHTDTLAKLTGMQCQLWQHRPGKPLGCRVGKGWHGAGKGLLSRESSPGTQQAGTGNSVTLACRQGAGSQRPTRSHTEASMPVPQLPTHPGRREGTSGCDSHI